MRLRDPDSAAAAVILDLAANFAEFADQWS
jgi:hypothetical protein